MKILLISNMYPSETDETYGIFVKNTADQLTESGNVVLLSVIKGRAKSIFFKFFKYLYFILRSFFLINFSKYDLIYVHYINHSLIPLFFTIRKNKKIVMNAHGDDVLIPSSYLKFFLHKITRKLVFDAKLVIVPSNYFKNQFLKLYPGFKSNIAVIASGGVDPEVFNKSFSPKKKPLVIGFISRIDSGKGWDLFLDLANALGFDNYRYVMIGNGFQKDELLKKLKGNESIKFFTKLKHSELPNYIRDFDIFIFPTMLPESLGLVALEVLTMGIPVLASNIGAIPEYITDGVNGFLFEPGNLVDLIEKVNNLGGCSNEEYFGYYNNCKKSAFKYSAESCKNQLNDEFLKLVCSR